MTPRTIEVAQFLQLLALRLAPAIALLLTIASFTREAGQLTRTGADYIAQRLPLWQERVGSLFVYRSPRAR